MMATEIDSLMESIRQRTDIIEVIGEHIELGRDNKAVCPFHNDRNPSFSVNSGGQYFYCFGCGAGGDVIRFIELYEHLSFNDALEFLAHRAGLRLPSADPAQVARVARTKEIENILAQSVAFYCRNIPNEERAYITKSRNISPEMMIQFRIGYAAGGLRLYLLNECGYPLERCLEAGVLKKGPDGTVRDYFYERIIFPNILRGRVVHLTGRSLDGSEPKYLHLPGEIRHVYNEDALRNKRVIVTEGVTDSIAAEQVGLSGVALFGCFAHNLIYTANFDRCKEVLVCLDGDDTGRRRTLAIADLIGDRARIIELPDGTDLSDYLKDHSKEEFDGLVEEAKDATLYELSQIPANTDKVTLHGLLGPIIERLSRMDAAKVEAYLSDHIKPRFGLKQGDIDGYRKLINEQRRQEAERLKSGSSESSEKAEYTACFDGLVDLVEDEGKSAFLVRENDRLQIRAQVEREGHSFKPPPRSKIPWTLPRGSEVLRYDSSQRNLSQKARDAELFDDIVSRLRQTSELPDEKYYDLLAAWVLHTYMLEHTQYTPIICLFAVPERGKSRTGKELIFLAYRGICVESLRESYLFRVANDFGCSVFLDVRDIWRKAEKYGSDDILLLRYERGAVVPRVLYPEKGAFKDTAYFKIFGPTIIATNEAVHRILETRAIQINMPETSKRFENDVTPENSLPLKERLVAFRARHLNERLPDIAKPASGRLGDILKPLLQIILMVRPEREGGLRELVRELEMERLAEKSDSLEARVLEAVCRSASVVEQGKLRVSDITEALNEGTPEKHKVSSRTVGRRLTAMGFAKTRVAGGKMAIVWNQAMIERLRESYGFETTSQTSLTSEELADNDLTREVSSEDQVKLEI